MRLLKNAYEQNLASTYRLAACRRFLSLFLIPDPNRSYRCCSSLTHLDQGSVLAPVRSLFGTYQKLIPRQLLLRLISQEPIYPT